MTNVEKIALAKALKDKEVKEARGEVEAGEYAVDFVAHIFGAFKVGEDYTQNKTAAMPQIKMLLAAIMLNGISVKAFMRRYLDGEFEVTPEQEKEIKEVWKELADNYNAEFKGKVTTNLHVEMTVPTE